MWQTLTGRTIAILACLDGSLWFVDLRTRSSFVCNLPVGIARMELLRRKVSAPLAVLVRAYINHMTCMLRPLIHLADCLLVM